MLFKAHLTFTKTEDNMVNGLSFRQGGNQNFISQKKSSPRHLAQGMRAGCISLFWVSSPNLNLNLNLPRATGNQNWL
jgi:hypothetical protein